MVNLKQLFLLFVLLLSGICSRAQGISHIEATKSWYYIYDQNGKKTKALSTNIGELQGFGASIFIVKSGSWYYIYDAKGQQAQGSECVECRKGTVRIWRDIHKSGRFMDLYLEQGRQED